MTFFLLNTQGLGFEEAHLPEDGMLRPFRKKRVPLGSSEKACVLVLVGPGLAAPWRHLGGTEPCSSFLGPQLSDLPDPGLGLAHLLPPPWQSQAPLI